MYFLYCNYFSFLYNQAMYIMEFNEIGKEAIWGGNKLALLYSKSFDKTKNIGESWEISGLEGSESIISNGELKGKTLSYAMKVYGKKLLGEDSNCDYFPLLIKIIDAKDKLSIQVHPKEDYANKRHHKHGKNEMWFVINAEKNAKLLIGMKEGITKDTLKEYLNSGKNIENMFNYADIKNGDAFYIPAGCVHAILGDVVLAEIQTPSDVTYRLYDWDRKDKNGNRRELHIEDSFNVIENVDYKTLKLNGITEKENGDFDLCKIISNEYFTVEKICLKEKCEYKFSTDISSFEIILVTEGSGIIEASNKIKLNETKTVLLPAFLGDYRVKTDSNLSFLKITK